MSTNVIVMMDTMDQIVFYFNIMVSIQQILQYVVEVVYVPPILTAPVTLDIMEYHVPSFNAMESTEPIQVYVPETEDV